MRPFPTLALVAVLAIGVPSFAQDRAEPDAPAQLDIEDVVKRLKSKEGDQRLVAATQALEIEDDAVTKPLARLLADEEFPVRAAAIRALGKRSTPRGKKDAARALNARLGKVAKQAHGEGEQMLVVEALGDLAQVSSVKALFDGITDETTDALFEARMLAVASIPHSSAIDELIQYLAGRGRGKWAGRKRAVVAALRQATGERFGGDPDDWRAWWKENEKSFDFEAATERRASDAAEQEKKKERRRKKKNKGGGSSD